MRKREQRIVILSVAGVMLAVAAILILVGLRQSVAYFAAPSELAQHVEPGKRLRLGGLVKTGSVAHEAGGEIRFVVTDGSADVNVSFHGLLPDLFREGQGVVAEGEMNSSGVFDAERLLAKHDETYMPREVTEALKQRGEWKGAQ